MSWEAHIAIMGVGWGANLNGMRGSVVDYKLAEVAGRQVTISSDVIYLCNLHEHICWHKSIGGFQVYFLFGFV